jgi:ferric-dicitrate binding protein FerR (iron transport regulator)
MSDFVRDLERELISAAHRRARRRTRRPHSLAATALVAVALAIAALSSGAARTDTGQAVATAGSCAFPDATQLLRDEPCTATPFRP